MLVVVYTGGRCVLCTALAVVSIGDWRAFAPPAESANACWLAAGVGMACFYGLLLISWWWYVTALLPSIHTALKGGFGDTYHHKCLPTSLRRWAWRQRLRWGASLGRPGRLL